MLFVLVRNADGFYVAPPGQEKSYTAVLEHARTFRTRAEAESERCVDSETVREVNSLLRKPRP